MRYAPAAEAQASYAIEDEPYDREEPAEEYFGLVREDIDFPNPNPHTPMATGGERRGPHVNSPDPKDYEFDLPCQPVDASVPLEIALGERTTTEEVDYEKHLFTEATVLPTATILHWQDELLEAAYVGCKAGLNIESSQGDPLTVTFNVMAASLDADTDDPGSAPALDVPQVTPYRFWMIGDMVLSDPDDGSSIKEVATINSVDAGWDHGLTANHHGNGREAYSISEDTSEEIYDITAGVTITDMDLYERAYSNEDPVDVEIPFHKDPSADPSDEAFILRFNNANIVQADSPAPGEGKVESDIGLLPTSTEIEIREPL